MPLLEIQALTKRFFSFSALSGVSLDVLMRSQGHTVSAAVAGEAALATYEPGRYDVALTNVGMAQMNGWELAERLRAHDAAVPILFITGWGMREADQARLNALRIDACLYKLSSLPSYSSEQYPFPGLHEHLRRVHDAFGARRMLWGTDYSRLPVPYEDCLRLFTEALAFLSDDDRAWIVGRAVREWVGFTR
jgi:CheY-like chemotaxis protein